MRRPAARRLALTPPAAPSTVTLHFFRLGGGPDGGGRLNKKDLKKFKSMLEESKRQLLASAKKTLTEEASFDTDDLPDEIDQASSEYSQSMIFRLRDREKFLLAKIDKALARVESGTFGICEKCEEEISLKRLEARPVTTLCIRCKEEQEQKEKSFG
jgi:DnaK suppressor protein